MSRQTFSQIKFTPEREVEAIEIKHNKLKFIVEKIDNNKPLSYYITPQLIKDKIKANPQTNQRINDHVTVEVEGKVYQSSKIKKEIEKEGKPKSMPYEKMKK